MSETNAERMARIKKEWNSVEVGFARRSGKTLRLFQKIDDMSFVIQQAEQTESFKQLHKKYLDRYVDAVGERNSLIEENEQLRQALKFYASEKMWTEPKISYHEDKSYEGPPNAIEDSGDIARKALEGTE